MKREKPFRIVTIASVVILLASACVSCVCLRPSPISSQQKPLDAKAQQRYYDQGLQHYSKEKYELAREAFRKVVEISPNNTLGARAKENLVKINQILKTLEGMKSK